VLNVDANDSFARFVTTLLDRYDGWTRQLTGSMEGEAAASSLS
jgi:hypothetical protein